MRIKKSTKEKVVRLQISEFEGSKRLKSKGLTLYETSIDEIVKIITKAASDDR